MLVVFAALAFAPSVGAEEVEVKYASVSAGTMKQVRRIEIEPSYIHNFLVQPWRNAYAQLIARKAAPNKPALGALRVEVAIDGDTMSIRLGELVGGVWRAVPDGSRIDLTLRVPARLMPPAKQPVPVEQPPLAGAVAMQPR